MEHSPRLRLAPSAALKEKRLAALMAGRAPGQPLLAAALREAQLIGSLELAGQPATLEEVRAAVRGDEVAPAAVRGLARAHGAVAPDSPLSVRTLVKWNAALTLGEGALRSSDRERPDGPPPSPPEFIGSRLAILEHWMEVESSRELRPAQQGALVMARLVEILPFEAGNGRVARLAASHLMVRAGSRPPILYGADAPRLSQALSAAFRLETEPLSALLDEAAERALDLALQTLEAQPPP